MRTFIDPWKTLVETSENAVVWEKELIEKIVLQSLKEQRARRRWNIFFRLSFLGIVIASIVAFALFGRSEKTLSGRHTAVISIYGEIAASGENTANKINEALRLAVADKNTAGVILLIDSPGGSPVQSGIVYDEIVRLRAQFPETPIHAVIEDIGASGAYYIAAAADKIFVDKASLVGSIGVIMSGFGFTGAMEKLGVERRLLAAGENKGFLDPFSPQEAKQTEFAHALLGDIHAQFIDAVKKGRGERLKETPEMFSGLIWTGKQSVELGLADSFGSVDFVAREVIKAEELYDYSVKENIAERVAKKLGAEIGKQLSLQIKSNQAPLEVR